MLLRRETKTENTKVKNAMMILTLNNFYRPNIGFYVRDLHNSAAYEHGQHPTGHQLMDIMDHYRTLGYDAIGIGNGSMDALTYCSTIPAPTSNIYDIQEHKYIRL